ncbi:hypothetical protein N0B44_21375 [Roseibacterium beibuensis]|uniref:hypothetical protein n=1 Tax=[Roseibacterium] beibuensis TaxID=1193142 RepID=UPI00217F0595|nr:hypothetical protein [Roseibacterium beibuensis]MCS6625467.1 hypothetical protein [Roseibacterium beibuensis]
MTVPEPLILLSGFAPTSPENRESLELRMKRFLEREPSTEPLDAPEFGKINGSESKADYLLARRKFVAELKTLNSNPFDRVEQRLRRRFAQPGSPILFGSMDIGKLLEGLSDQDELLKSIHGLIGRKVRSNLKKSSEQIAAIRSRFSIPEAAGLTILLNENEEMIDAATVGYSIINKFQEHPENYASIQYVWASIESVFIQLPDGRSGFPQVLVCKSREPAANEVDFLLRMITAWAQFNGSEIVPIKHDGRWDALQPIYRGAPPTMSPF